MSTFLESLILFLETEDGATAIEYGLLTALIAIGALGGFSALGGAVVQMWNGVMTAIGAALGS
ncbi:MAG: Flp family type IVb pilin [Nitrospiraceae bacterium]